MRFYACLLALSVLFVQSAPAQESESEFSTPTIDLGCVVSDIDASVTFYTEAIGFKKAGGFKVAADYANDVGLTDNKSLDITVLALGDGAGATKLKLMQVDGGKKAPNDHIHTTYGYSYITVMVKSSDAAMKRLKAAGVKPVAKSPLSLPGNPNVILTIVRDPDGNLVELVGPN